MGPQLNTWQTATEPQATHLDGMVASHFDRAFLFFNLFEDDPRTCLDLCDAVFRGMGHEDASDEAAFYAHLVHHLRELSPHPHLPGVATDSLVCWLLKDAAELSYAEIGALMTMERAHVQRSIADVRMALLG